VTIFRIAAVMLFFARLNLGFLLMTRGSLTGLRGLAADSLLYWLLHQRVFFSFPFVHALLFWVACCVPTRHSSALVTDVRIYFILNIVS